MAAPARPNIFLPPLSTVSVYIAISRDCGLTRHPEDESTSLIILKHVARFVSSAIAIPFFTWLSVFYNTTSFVIKGSFALLTEVSQGPLLEHTHNAYMTDMHNHLAYIIKDFAINFFIGLFCIIYCWYPVIAANFDGSLNDHIYNLCLDNPA